MGLLEHAVGQRLAALCRYWHPSPEEQAHLIPVVLASERVHDALRQDAPTAIDGIHPVVPFARRFERFHHGRLHRAELPRVYIALHAQDPRHELCIRGQHGHAPARHVVRLAHRIQLDAHLLGALHSEDAARVIVQNEAVWVVVTDDDAVPTPKVDQALQQLVRRVRTCRHVRIIGPHQLDRWAQRRLTFGHEVLQRLKVGLPSARRLKRVRNQLRTHQTAHRAISRVSRVGHQDAFAGVEEGHRDVQDALFRPDERQHFTFRIQRDAIPLFVPRRVASTQLGHTRVGLIAVHIGACHLAPERLDSHLRRRQVGAADAEADHAFTGGIHGRHFLQFLGEVILLHRTDAIGRPYAKCFVFLVHIRPVFSSR